MYCIQLFIKVCRRQGFSIVYCILCKYNALLKGMFTYLIIHQCVALPIIAMYGIFKPGIISGTLKCFSPGTKYVYMCVSVPTTFHPIKPVL